MRGDESIGTLRRSGRRADRPPTRTSSQTLASLAEPGGDRDRRPTGSSSSSVSWPSAVSASGSPARCTTASPRCSATSTRSPQAVDELLAAGQARRGAGVSWASWQPRRGRSTSTSARRSWGCAARSPRAPGWPPRSRTTAAASPTLEARRRVETSRCSARRRDRPGRSRTRPSGSSSEALTNVRKHAAAARVGDPRSTSTRRAGSSSRSRTTGAGSTRRPSTADPRDWPQLRPGRRSANGRRSARRHVDWRPAPGGGTIVGSRSRSSPNQTARRPIRPVLTRTIAMRILARRRPCPVPRRARVAARRLGSRGGRAGSRRWRGGRAGRTP